jgi:ATP-binding cassette subfamily B protein
VPSDQFEPVSAGVSRLDRFWELIGPHRSVLLQALVGALVYTILGLSTAVFIQGVVDHVIVENNYELLNMMGIIMVCLLFLRVLIGVFKDIFILQTGQLIDSRLILGYYKHLLKLPQQFFDTMRVGEITSRVSDAVKIRLFINDVSINLMVSVLMLVSSLALMFTYYWKLALMMCLVVPIYCLIYFITNTLNKRSQRKLMEDSAELESQLLESLNAIATIKRFALEQYSNNRTESRFIILLRTVYRSGMNSLFSGTSTEFTSQLFTILLLWVGSGFVLSQQISPGELLSFYTLIGYFTTPVSSFVGMNKIVQDALIAADRLFEIMDLEREAETDSRQIELTGLNIGNLRFSGVTFRYGTRANVFSNLNLEIPLKGMTGIVGESGCGKSTLVALLHNIYHFDNGNIFIGDYSIKYITNRSLREIIAVVPQVTDLFSGSVLSNITIGKDEIDMPKVLQICTKLGIINFIEGLPEGFQTNVGENGLALSGGQKQRIAIARALYRDPEILILDEATSSLDLLSEQYVQDTISDFLKQGKTVIIIAHRLSTIQKADKIIVLKDGAVKEEGSHAELIALGSEYYKLWTKHTPIDAAVT